ncbi:MAG: hypothetical protein ACFB4I_12610 [Cyanophyceae cyanobacterium]
MGFSALTELPLRAFGTGFGIIIGNSMIKFFAHRKAVNETKKIFSFAIEEQLSSLSALVVCLDKVRFLLGENYSEITTEQNPLAENRLELRNNAVVVQQTVEQLLENDFYNQLLGEQRIFPADVIAITGKYFGKLQQYLVSLKLFFSSLPVEEAKTQQKHHWPEQKVLLEKLEWLITQAEVTIDRGNMSKIVLDQNKNFREQNEAEILARRFYSNEECSRYCDRHRYSEAQELDEIQAFVAQHSVEPSRHHGTEELATENS